MDRFKAYFRARFGTALSEGIGRRLIRVSSVLSVGLAAVLLLPGVASAAGSGSASHVDSRPQLQSRRFCERAELGLLYRLDVLHGGRLLLAERLAGLRRSHGIVGRELLDTPARKQSERVLQPDVRSQLHESELLRGRRHRRANRRGVRHSDPDVERIELDNGDQS